MKRSKHNKTIFSYNRHTKKVPKKYELVIKANIKEQVLKG